MTILERIIAMNLSGSLKYDTNRTYDGAGTGMAGIPIVLQNTDDGRTIAVLTDSNGNYTFNDVPDGNYQVVEKADWFPKPGAVGSYSFNWPETKPIITDGGVTPLISADPNQPNRAVWNAKLKGGENAIDGVGETTKKFRISGSDVYDNKGTKIDSNNNNMFARNKSVSSYLTISNGPVKNTSFVNVNQSDIAGLTENKLTGLDGGNMGTYPQGKPAESYESSYPIGSGYAYSTTGQNPPEGAYVDRNSRVSGATWWNVSGHTKGNEMDRFLTFNGGTNTTTVLSQDVTVEPNSKYLISAWFMNLTKDPTYVGRDQYRNPIDIPYADPQVKLIVKDDTGATLYSSDLGGPIPKNFNMPEWKQYGDVIGTGPNTRKLTIQVEQRGGINNGNDFALDDIQVLGVPANPKPTDPPPAGVNQTKKVNNADLTEAKVNDIVTYSFTVKNTLANEADNTQFQDILPPELTFESGSVTVNGTTQSSYNPNDGFSLGNIVKDQTVTITFRARVNSVPNRTNPSPHAANEAPNNSTVSYTYNFNTENNKPTPITYTDKSNTVYVAVDDGTRANVTTTKTADKENYNPGETVTYTINVGNAGPSTAKTPYVKDSVPTGISNPQYTVLSPQGATMSQGAWVSGVTLNDLRSHQRPQRIRAAAQTPAPARPSAVRTWEGQSST